MNYKHFHGLMLDTPHIKRDIIFIIDVNINVAILYYISVHHYHWTIMFRGKRSSTLSIPKADDIKTFNWPDRQNIRLQF